MQVLSSRVANARITTGLTVAGLMALTFGSSTAANALAVAISPINASFAGTGGMVTNPTGETYDTQFNDPNGAVVTDFSGLNFVREDLTLNYSPVGFDNLAQPADVSLFDTFTGTDILTTGSAQTVDLSLSGTYSGPSGQYYSPGGGILAFTGTGTITGGTLGLMGNVPFSATETEAAITLAVPGGVIQPQQQPTGPASYISSYGAIAVPEPSSFALIGLGLLPLVFAARRKARAVG
jgi:hypothetical protein